MSASYALHDNSILYTTFLGGITLRYGHHVYAPWLQSTLDQRDQQFDAAGQLGELQLPNRIPFGRQPGSTAPHSPASNRGWETPRSPLKERWRHSNSAISFIENQPNAIELMDAFDIYWRNHKGDQTEPTATATIFALDDLIRKETELADMLRTTISEFTTSSPQHNSTLSTNEPMDVESVRKPTMTPLHTSGGSLPSHTAAGTMNVQLRKVELLTFDGDFSTYYDYWAKFKTAVHDNPSLSTAVKFIHLSSSLKGSAALVVQEYDITDPSNYHLAIEALRRRYDRPQFTHNFLLQKLEKFPASSAAASSQRDTLCQIQACILQLNRFEDTPTSLSLKTLIRSKFPQETQLEVNRMEDA